MSSKTVIFDYDPERNILFAADYYTIASRDDADSFWTLYRGELERIGRRVHLVAKIDGLHIRPDLDRYYGSLARQVSGEWFLSFARYGSTAASRLGMAVAAQVAGFVTGVHRSREEAAAAVLGGEAWA